MATGPDPNRFIPTDSEPRPSDDRRGDGPGDLRSARLGLPTRGVAVLLAARPVVFPVLRR